MRKLRRIAVLYKTTACYIYKIKKTSVTFLDICSDKVDFNDKMGILQVWTLKRVRRSAHSIFYHCEIKTNCNCFFRVKEKCVEVRFGKTRNHHHHHHHHHHHYHLFALLNNFCSKQLVTRLSLLLLMLLFVKEKKKSLNARAQLEIELKDEEFTTPD